MKRAIVWTHDAAGDLKRLDRALVERVTQSVQRFADDGTGDVKRLQGKGGELRLRVGDWRVRFTCDATTITVLRVLPRGSAYRD